MMGFASALGNPGNKGHLRDSVIPEGEVIHAGDFDSA